MIAYQKRQLPADDIGEPGDLPAELQGLADISLADLIWTDEALGYHGFGYFPVTLPDPPGPRREIPKSTVQARLADIGKFDTVFAILLAQPIYFGRWFAPDWPNVFFDDADMLTLLAVAGCTSEEIAVITAAV